MRFDISFIIGLVAICCGCATDGYKSGRGDAGQFILKKAVAFGGLPVSTNGLPVVSDRWTSSEDQFGVDIRMMPEQYLAVVAFLRQAFGQPKFGPTVSEDGKAGGGGYRLTPKGGGILFRYDTDIAEVTILRPLKKASDSR